jgi:hypothetical protein
MNEQTYKFRSSIHSSLKKQTLLRGSFIAALGALLIACGGIFLTVQQLGRWGIIIYGLGIALIALGLIPYRRMCRLEECPDQLVVSEDGLWSYYRRNKLIFTLPQKNIKKIDYIDNKSWYGISIACCTVKKLKMKIYDFKTAKKFFCKKKSAQIFLPYLSRNTYNALNELII